MDEISALFQRKALLSSQGDLRSVSCTTELPAAIHLSAEVLPLQSATGIVRVSEPYRVHLLEAAQDTHRL